MDAKDKTLGRISTEIVAYLMGKHKPNYSTHMDMGDYVVVVNSKDIKVTGNKIQDKKYVRHSGYPGGYREIKYMKYLKETPSKILEHAISGMLPENRLKKKRLARLKLFVNDRHTYSDKFRPKAE